MDQNRRTWKEMVTWSQDLLRDRTGHDVAWWAERARQAGCADEAGLASWLRDEHGVTGYAASAVSWEVFGYPDFLLQEADQLLDAQYAGREQLRPVADAILAWADRTDGVAVQLRKGFVSLHSPRRKFAQLTAVSRSAVELRLRWEGPPPAGFEPAPDRAGDPPAQRTRLREVSDVDDDLLAALTAALAQNS